MRHRTILLVAMLAGLGLLMLPGVAFAHWETNLCQTPGQKLKWTGSSTSYFAPDTNDKYENGVADASGSITNGTDFNFNRTSSQAAGVTWAFGDYGDTGWDGTNATTYNYGTCRIAHVDAWLNKYYLAPYQPGRAQSVAIHEDGHSIGMRHFTDGCLLRSMMQELTTCRWGQLGVQLVQAHDVTDINATY